MTWIATKTYGAERGLSCALRQWPAESHCALIHGYSLGFRFTFAAEQLDRRGWVVDFGAGGFGQIRAWLHEVFDHALLVAEDDPALHDPPGRPDFLRDRPRARAGRQRERRPSPIAPGPCRRSPKPIAGS